MAALLGVYGYIDKHIGRSEVINLLLLFLSQEVFEPVYRRSELLWLFVRASLWLPAMPL